MWLIEPGDGLLHVEDLELEARADDDALVGDLTARLGVQRGLGEDHLGDLALRRAVDRDAVDEDAEHAATPSRGRCSR